MKIGAEKTIFFCLQFSTLKRSYLLTLYIQLEVDIANLQVRSNIIKLKI